MAPDWNAKDSPLASPSEAAWADVGPHGDQHADEAGRAREDRADRKPDGRQRSDEHRRGDEHHDADNADGGVLTTQIGLRAFLDRCGDLLHAWITR